MNWKTRLLMFHPQKFWLMLKIQLEQLPGWKIFASVVYLWLVVVAIFVGLGGLAAGVDLALRHWQGVPAAEFDLAAIANTLTAMSRSVGQLLGLALTCLAIALPVTANLYTPRLIKLFMTDPFNLAILGLLMLLLTQNILAHYATEHSASMMFTLHLTLALFFLAVTLLVPYFWHMSKYFNPSFLLLRLEKETVEQLDLIHQSPIYQNKHRVQVLINLNNLSNMVLKSISRSDREVAMAGIQVFRRLMDHYATIKPAMPEAWLELDYSRFTGMSSDGLSEVNRRKIWFELLILRSLSQAFANTLNSLQDLASAIAEQNQHIGLTCLMQNDGEAVALCIRSFNTYLTQAMDRRDKISVHNVFYQYQRFVEMLMAFDPETARDVVRHIRFHAVRASQRNLANVLDAALYDLMQLTIVAYSGRNQMIYQYLCESVMNFNIPAKGKEVDEIIKAKLIFGSFLLRVGDETHLAKLWPQIQTISQPKLAYYYQQLILRNEKFQNEITDRLISFSFLPEKHLPSLVSLFERLGYTLPQT